MSKYYQFINNKNMKKFEEPIVKVVKFKAMDVIATSGDTSYMSTGEVVSKGYTLDFQ